MKVVKVFALFLLLQLSAWGGTHWYLQSNQTDILVVVDTSFSMKPNFNRMRDWIDNFEANTRYRNIVIGTDKALLGDLDALPSKDHIFRTAFGRFSEDSLTRLYSHLKPEKRYLLTSAGVSPSGWEVVNW